MKETTYIKNGKTYVKANDGYTYVYSFMDRAVNPYADSPINAFLTKQSA